MKIMCKKTLSLCVVLALTTLALPINAQALYNNVSFTEGLINEYSEGEDEAEGSDGEEAVDIPDLNLKQALTDKLDGPITQENLKTITNLSIPKSNITDIKGLEYCTSLTELNLNQNEIRDISPLSGLNSLNTLTLTDNEVSDLRPLSGLASLRTLHLHRNQISDISPLSGLISLDELALYGNQISNISHLSGLTSLTYLVLSDNEISDISTLSKLTSLTYLTLSDNEIEDITSLSDLTSLQFLSLYSNKISDITPLDNIINNGDFGDIYIDLSNQNIKLDSIVLFDNIYEMDIINKLPSAFNLEDMEIYNINPNTASLNGNGKISFNDLSGFDTLSYEFELHKTSSRGASIFYYGSVGQDYTLKATNEKPVIEGATDKTIYVGDNFDPKENVTASDLEDGDLTDNIEIIGSVDTSKAGEYEITYSVKDSDGNETSVTVKINVKNKSGGGGGSTEDPKPNPPAPPKIAIIASGEKYTDVLTATVLASEKDAPILLTSKDNIDENTLAEIKRLDVVDIIISGGVDSVSEKVVEQLKDYNVTRIAGHDRFETAEKIGNEVRKITGNKEGAMLVDGTNFPDVITMSSLASGKRVPILLTDPQTLTNTTKDTLKSWGINDITIGGGYNSVSKDIENNLGVSTINRFGGADRYETAKLIGNEVRKVTGGVDNMILVDGTNFPDGITINILSANFKAPIMLTEPTQLNSVTSDKIEEWSIENILIGGGYNSVSKDIEDNLKVSKIERVAGQDRYETAVEISKRLSHTNTPIGDK